MRLIILLVVILSVYISPAAGYEVIFHQGFEGEQFPPAGWENYGAYKKTPGYESEWCAEFFAWLSEGGILISKEIPIEGNELYEFRIHSKAISGGRGEHYAYVIFDDDTLIDLGLPWLLSDGGYDWTLFSITAYAPNDAETVHFYVSCTSPGDVEFMYWDIDNVSVILTYDRILPTSLGRVKVVYR